MKELPDQDPRSWKHQGKIHCAYCNGAYSQYMNGHPELKIQVHNNSPFFPFHRWYLYFYECILGSLIEDPTFGLPYWNRDNPKGMLLPDMFEAPYPLTQTLLNHPIPNSTHCLTLTEMSHTYLQPSSISILQVQLVTKAVYTK
ncbi:putative catechol oxidase [Helianthus debilis subsp. tardiflorus]